MRLIKNVAKTEFKRIKYENKESINKETKDESINKETKDESINKETKVKKVWNKILQSNAVGTPLKVRKKVEQNLRIYNRIQDLDKEYNKRLSNYSKNNDVQMNKSPDIKKSAQMNKDEF